MTCPEARELLGAYLDGELDKARRAEVEAHLATCSDCPAALKRLSELSAATRGAGLYEKAPAYLEARVRAALRETTKPARGPTFAWMRWGAVAACLALAVGLAWYIILVRPGQAERQLIAQDVVASHLRSLQGDHLLDVPSTDRHTVKPWFNGKLDFAPPVKDLAGQGFPLIGGRLDYLNGHPVAALVFHRRQHTINLFIWPAEGSAKAETVATARGYNVVRWAGGGMAFWAVSDLPASELQEFGRLYSN